MLQITEDGVAAGQATYISPRDTGTMVAERVMSLFLSLAIGDPILASRCYQVFWHKTFLPGITTQT